MSDTLEDWLRVSWRRRVRFWFERLRLRVDYWLNPPDNDSNADQQEDAR